MSTVENGKRVAPAPEVARREDRGAVMAARHRPMSERLELALSWNSVAAELRAGLARQRTDASP